MTHLRRTLLAALAAIAVLLGAAGTAQAEDGYRFWGYYTWTGQEWTFATVGAHENIPEDGSVEGWRYAVSGNTPRLPRAKPDFDTICAGVPGEDGKKRIAVVIDYGTDSDAPDGSAPEATGTCVVADDNAHGLDLLRAAGEVRDEANMVCGVNSHPETGCGDPVPNIDVPTDEEPVELKITDPVGSSQWDPSTTPTAKADGDDDAEPVDDSDSAWPTVLLGGGILLVIVATGFILTRRRQRHHEHPGSDPDET
ncbi:SCO2322 family protein [Enemella sp. A6]|uniref:SCO2322 family protein n=1 Tax=Enemella sp. A6 TaxID=3440152 RepID=UPI003EB80780